MVPQRIRERPTTRHRALHAVFVGGAAQDGRRPREGLSVLPHAQDRDEWRAELRPDELRGLELVLCWYIYCMFYFFFSFFFVYEWSS